MPESRPHHEPNAEAHPDADVTGPECGRELLTELQELREAQEALRLEQEKLRAVIESIPVGIGLTDPQGTILSLNAEGLRIHGFASEAEMFDHLDRYVAYFELCYPDGSAMPLEDWPLARAMRGEYVRDFDVLLIRRVSGERRFIKYGVVPIRDRTERVILHVVNMVDLTGTQQAEEAQREREERFRALFSSIDEGYCLAEIIQDAQGRPVDYRFLEVNPLFEEMTGLRDATGRTAYELVPDLEPKWVNTYAHVALDGETLRFVSGSEAMERWFDVFATPVAPRGRFALVFKDITEQRRAALALSESEERFRTLADNIAQLAWMADSTGWIFWYNRRWFEYTGTTLEEMQGWGWQKVHHPDHLLRVVERIQRSWDTGEVWEDTFPLRSKSGEYRWFLSRAIPIRDETGKVTRWFGTNTDVTSQRAVEEELREANRRKDEFLAMLAHELRNPLAPIVTAAAVLEAHGPNDPLLKRQEAIIQRQARHMARLVSDLLDVSRINQGKLSLQLEPVNLVEIVRQCVEDYRDELEGKGLILEVRLPREPLLLDGDPVRLCQAVANLLSNAGKFTPAGGRVEVELCREEDRTDQVRIVVRDTGVGIPADLLPRIWESFVQGEQELARTTGGLGLGLSLVRGIIELHGGTVFASSPAPSPGAQFVLRLPLRTLPVAKLSIPHEPVQTPTLPSERPCRVLIIEDNRDAAESLQDLLQLTGYEVRLAFSGPEGLGLAHTWTPHVVLCDIGLPEMDGYRVTESLRADPRTADAVLIALTGYAEPESRERGRAAGFDHYLPKPTDPAELLRTLKESLHYPKAGT